MSQEDFLSVMGGIATETRKCFPSFEGMTFRTAYAELKFSELHDAEKCWEILKRATDGKLHIRINDGERLVLVFPFPG
jgi:hypothetical protein